jgi:DNA-binding NarL/FixJ family response regulator
METRRVFIVGHSLFAEALARTLTSDAVEVSGSAPTPEAAIPLIKAQRPDAVIVANASADETPPATFGQFLAAYPDLPIIYADLSTDDVQVITSQRLSARSSDLLAAIAALPKRS